MFTARHRVATPRPCEMVASATKSKAASSVGQRIGAYLCYLVAMLSALGLLSACATQPQDATTTPAVVPADTATPNATPATTLTAGSISVTDLKRLTLDLVSPAFSPDGSMILGGAKDGLEVGSADGSGLRSIAPDATSFSWSPDSKKIAVTVVSGGLTSSAQSADVVVMNADGSSPTNVGTSDFPTYVQFLPDGRLAYVQETRLYLLDTAAGFVSTEVQASPIVNDDRALTPFLVSDDGRFVATVHGTSLSVQNLVSGGTKRVTDSLDGQRRSGYSWSSAGLLAYSDQDLDRTPNLHLYNPTTDSERVLLQGTGRGEFSGVRWSAPNWLILVFYPVGTVAETLAEYRAVNVNTGANTLLFENGFGLTLSAGGRKLIFTRSATANQPFSLWVATLAVN